MNLFYLPRDCQEHSSAHAPKTVKIPCCNTDTKNHCQTTWATQQQYLLAELQHWIHWYFHYILTPWVSSKTYLLIWNTACSGSTDGNTIQLLMENRQRRYCWLQVILHIINFKWSQFKSSLFSPQKCCFRRQWRYYCIKGFQNCYRCTQANTPSFI